MYLFQATKLDLELTILHSQFFIQPFWLETKQSFLTSAEDLQHFGYSPLEQLILF